MPLSAFLASLFCIARDLRVHEGGESWEAHPASRRCPQTERKLLDFLQHEFRGSVRRSVKFDWCRNPKGDRYEFDFHLPEMGVLIELDGMQHFVQVRRWKSPQARRESDVRKMREALARGFSFVRVSQPEVASDSIPWEDEVAEAIGAPADASFVAGDPHRYDEHLKALERTVGGRSTHAGRYRRVWCRKGALWQPEPRPFPLRLG